VWGRAITKALGLDPQHFIDAYEENIDAQNLEAVRASPISDALIKLMELNPLGWSGTASQLYSALEEQAKNLKISTRQKAWPKKPHVLSRALNELAPSLPAVGLEVERGREENTRLIYINSVRSVQSVQRQSDWGKGTDLRAYLKPEAASMYAPYASYGISESLSGIQTPPPSEGAVDKEKIFEKEDLQSPEQPARGRITVNDLLSKLRAEWTSGYEKDFIDLAVEIGALTRNEAVQLFRQQVDEGRILMDPEGFWRWM